MKPAPFDYAAPESLDEAIAVLSSGDPDETKILAGGQSLVPLLNMRLARPSRVVDLGRIRELDFIRSVGSGHDGVGGVLSIGAMTTKRAVEESALVRARSPLFWRATTLIGHPQIRNRGTIGGSMVQADPAAEYPAVAVALDAVLVARGPHGERTIAAEDFFVTYLTTSLEPGEILTEVRLPDAAPRTGWSIVELARRHGDFAIVGAVATLRVEAGRIRAPRVVVFGATDRARRQPEAESALDGQPPSTSLFEAAGARAAASLEDPTEDAHASAEYRRDLARVLVRRALVEAAERAA